MNTIKINNIIKDICFIFNNYKIEMMLEKGWIAGGFARVIGKHVLEENEIKIENKIKDYLFKSHGDIDFFFRESKEVNRIVKELKLRKDAFAYSHLIGGAYEHNQSNKEYFLHDSVFKVQVVSEFIFNNIKDCFNSFDFDNCKFAITKYGYNYYLHYTDSANKFTKNKTLNICHANSPLLLNRVVKYLNKKDINNLSKNSESFIKENMFRIVSGNWSEKYNPFFRESFGREINRINMNHFRSHLIMFEKANGISKEMLTLFLGKIVKKEYKYSYGHYEEIDSYDWAAERLLYK